MVKVQQTGDVDAYTYIFQKGRFEKGGNQRFWSMRFVAKIRVSILLQLSLFQGLGLKGGNLEFLGIQGRLEYFIFHLEYARVDCTAIDSHPIHLTPFSRNGIEESVIRALQN